MDFPIPGTGSCYLELAPDIFCAPSWCLEPPGTQVGVPTNQEIRVSHASCDMAERGSEQLLGGGGTLRGALKSWVTLANTGGDGFP